VSGEVRYERTAAAAVLTIDRPARRNAVDGATAKALRRGFEQFEADGEARVLVLAGAGGEAFCAGADLKALDLDVDDAGGPMGFSRLTPSKPAIASFAASTACAVPSLSACTKAANSSIESDATLAPAPLSPPLARRTASWSPSRS